MLKRLLRSNLIVLAFANLNNLLNYLNQLVLGRNLSAEDYGVFNAVNAIAAIIASAFMVLPFVVTRSVVRHAHQPPVQRALVRKLSWLGLAVCAAVILILAAGAGGLARYLRLPEATPVFLLTLWVASALFVLLYTGVINGLMRYVTSTIQTFAQGLARFLLTLLFVMPLALSYNAAILAGVMANLLAAAWMARTVRRALPAASPPEAAQLRAEMREMARFALPVTLHWVAIGFLTNIDVVMVKHFHSPEEAGIYSAAAITARIATFLPMVLLSVLFPEVTSKTRDNQSSLPVILVTLALTTCLSGAYALLVLLFPEFVVTSLFGAKYASSSGYLPVITTAMALLAVINVLFSAFLAKSRFGFLYPAYAGLALTAGLIYFALHDTPAEVALGVLIGGGFVLATSLALLLAMWNRPAKAALER